MFKKGFALRLTGVARGLINGLVDVSPLKAGSKFIFLTRVDWLGIGTKHKFLRRVFGDWGNNFCSLPFVIDASF